MSANHIGRITFLVRDYDEAIAYFLDKLGFMLIEDKDMGAGKRWVVVAPAKDAQAGLLLAKATTAGQAASIGNQAGGRVFLFLYTDDFQGNYQRMRTLGVEFLEAPREESYGIVVKFKDLYGNQWDLLQRR